MDIVNNNDLALTNYDAEQMADDRQQKTENIESKDNLQKSKKPRNKKAFKRNSPKKNFGQNKAVDDSKPAANKLRIVPLGGVEEIGVNCTVYEYQDEILVVDLGLGFSEFDYYGIDAVVPDIKYLTQKSKKISAVLITHGHLDHIGALPYHLETLGFPDVYASEFTIEIIKAKLEDKNLLNKMQNKFHVVDPKSKLKFRKFNVEFFHVNHSIPQCLGIVIQAPNARVIHTGDFKFDNTPVNEPVADYARIAELGSKGVDLLLADSTNSLRKGHPISESEVAKNLEDVIEHANGRIIVGTFSGLVGRLYQLIEIARKHNRKVAIAGYSMNQTLRIAQQIGYIKVPQNLIVPIQSIGKLKPEHVMILTTGAQGEPDAALSKMANEDYKGFVLQKGDTIVISAKTIPGNDRAVQLLVDSITRRGAYVVQMDDLDLFTSGHGYQEDQKIMLNLVKPRFFMPVHGYQYFLRAHGQTAINTGIKEDHVIISQRGSIIEGDRFSGFKVIKKFQCEPLIVSGSGVGDVGTAVLREREQLASYGMIIISLMIDKDKKLVRTPFVLTKGFVYVKSSQELIREIEKTAEETYSKTSKEDFDLNEIKDRISEQVSKLVYRETEREPVTLTIVNLI